MTKVALKNQIKQELIINEIEGLFRKMNFDVKKTKEFMSEIQEIFDRTESSETKKLIKKLEAEYYNSGNEKTEFEYSDY